MATGEYLLKKVKDETQARRAIKVYTIISDFGGGIQLEGIVRESQNSSANFRANTTERVLDAIEVLKSLHYIKYGHKNGKFGWYTIGDLATRKE